MSPAANEFCPIYRGAQLASRPSNAHAGLYFDKFPNRWKFGRAGIEFNKNEWLNEWSGKSVGESQLLTEFSLRQARMVEELGGFLLCLKNTSRFATGLGRAHPLENGFSWHPTLGVPYLPGSGVKGVVRAWDREENGRWGDSGVKESAHFEIRYGSQNRVGQWSFLELLPMAPPQLVKEIMTPHYGPYYSEGEIPGDWHDPTPIPFLAVETECVWQVGVIPVGRLDKPDDIEVVKQLLLDALEWNGAGAKTAVGYGRFERDKFSEDRLRKVVQVKAKEKERERARAERLESLTGDVRKLEELAAEQDWFSESGNTAMLEGLESYLQSCDSLDQHAVQWLKDKVFEPNNKGIWANPEAVGGKKNKPKYKKRWVNLVKRVKSLAEG